MIGRLPGPLGEPGAGEAGAEGSGREPAPSTVLLSPGRLALRRLAANRAALAAALFVLLLALVAVFAPYVAPHDPTTQFADGLTAQGQPVPSTLPHSTRFLLGTDANGRDLLSRLIWGARVSLTVGVLANALAVGVGLLVGATAAYVGGWPGQVLMRLTDMVMAFPTLLLALALIAVLKPGMGVIILVIGGVYWTWIARVIYGEVRAIREQEFILAAESLGASRARILFRHVVPQLVPTLIVWTSLGIATNVMLEASLSYLGIGIQPPTPSWGVMIQEGQTYFRTAPWLVLYPGLAILLTVLSFNVLGDGLRDALDPRRGR